MGQEEMEFGLAGMFQMLIQHSLSNYLINIHPHHFSGPVYLQHENDNLGLHTILSSINSEYEDIAN
jgi:hypothetical protein